MFDLIAFSAIGAAVLLIGYTYVGYPGVLWLLIRIRKAPRSPGGDLPGSVSITVPAYNEANSIRPTLDRILEAQCPVDDRQILVISDASTDGTDEIVREYADRGVELHRMPKRSGKTAAENAALPLLRGELIINTDASVRIHPDAVQRLHAAFADPSVGVASGRDVSMSHGMDTTNAGEAGYVDYEMKVRELETDVGGIVGASGCLYAIRADLHRTLVPEALSRDFAAAMVAREHGVRGVSVWDAVCFVPRTTSLKREYRRKVRTITRGLETLFYKRHLLNPFRYGVFSWMLFSHKVCRWLVPWAGALAAVAIVAAATTSVWARVCLALGLVVIPLWAWARFTPEGSRPPRPVEMIGFVVAGNLAVLHAWVRAFRGELDPIWEPTRREASEVR